ncbi:MAG: phenylalanine--tRNA ligase subunit beta [Chitinophagales bacterium]
MKISWNWLQEILPTKISVEEASALLTDIGLETESVTQYESVKGGLIGLVVGYVESIEKHPDADRLQVTQINYGSETTVQVVCGAPNVKPGQKVIFAKVGTTLYPTNAESFEIRKAKIRGVSSEGMLCAEDEIGLGTSHDGLFILPDNAVIGSPLKDYFDVYSDFIFEIGLTANHADAFSHYGVARELKAALQIRNIESVDLKTEWMNKKIQPAVNSNFKVLVEDTEKCIRYSGVLIQDVIVGDSPQWIKNKLKSLGLRSINNIVDITNYVLHGLGQPMHAFDANAITGDSIIVKTLPEGISFITLDEKERKLSANDLMICNAEEPMCIAGVLGGLHSGVTENTTSVFLESACFNAKSIAKSERIHNIKTDASSRFIKGTDPEITLRALHLAASLILEIAGGKIASDIFDIYPKPVAPFKIRLRYKRLEDFIAFKIENKEVQEILQAIHIQIIANNETGIDVEVPSYKNDVTREIDLIEEVLRLYGYNNTPVPESIRIPFTLRPSPDKEQLRLNTGKRMSALGFYEIFTNSISRSKYILNFAPTLEKSMVLLKNSLNNELDCLRQTHIFSGLEVIQYNINRKQQNLKFYEFGKTFFKTNNGFDEKEIFVLYLTGFANEESWRTKQQQTDFFELKKYIHQIYTHQKIAFTEKALSNNAIFEYGNGIIVNKQQAGIYGLVNKSLTDAFDIKTPVWYAELDWNIILENSRITAPDFVEIPRYPEVRRDLALILNPEITFSMVKEVADKEGKNVLRDVILFDVYEGKNLEGKKSYALGLTFRDDEQTLTDTTIDAIMQSMMKRYETELNAIIRK